MRTVMLILALCAGAAAQTTVTGTITTPTGDLPSGSCTFTAAALSTTGSGWQMTGTPTTVNFSNGALRVVLIPTDTATPSGQYYQVDCTVPTQRVNGHLIQQYSWGPVYWLVPTSPSSTTISSVQQNTQPPPVSFTILWQQMAQNGATVGQFPEWNGTAWVPVGSSYSIDLLQPDPTDTGIVQKQDNFAYAISAVSCSVGPTDSPVTINLDVRAQATPNTSGTSVLSTPLACTSSGVSVELVSPALVVPANSPVALDVISTSNGPAVVRVHVSR